MIKKNKCTPESLKEEALKYSTRTEFEIGSKWAYRAAKRLDIYEEVCAHMPKRVDFSGENNPSFKWTNSMLHEEALKYNFRGDFKKNNGGAYAIANKRGLLDEICSHMTKFSFKGENNPAFKWTYEKLKQAALKYKNRSDFQKKDSGAYQSAMANGILDEICSHMTPHKDKWKSEEVLTEALKFHTISQFQKNLPGAYCAARKMGILNEVCSHMKRLKHKNWTCDEITEEAKKHNNREDLFNSTSGAYKAARRMGILDQVCSHMKVSSIISKSEKLLFDCIVSMYPKAQTLRDTKIYIYERPYIKRFDIDIYIPELRRGIEFDGKYWHSFKGLKRSHPHWPDEGIHDYHQLKDSWFLSKGIQILHIKEEDWDKDKEACIQRCLKFLKS